MFLSGLMSARRCCILHITFNMGIGGTEQVIRQLVLKLPKERFENHIVCIDGEIGEIGQQVSAAGTIIHPLQRRPGLDLNLIRSIGRIIKQNEIDVVHCHQYTPWFYGLLGAMGTGVKVVFTEHGRFHSDRYKAALVNPLLALLTDNVVAISSATRDALARCEFIPKPKIRLIYKGIQPLSVSSGEALKVRRELGILPGAFVVGAVARLDPIKNQKMMLRAFRVFNQQCADAWLLMVGDGPERQALEEYAEKLGIRERTCFTGFISEPACYLAAMNVFLLSSHSEGTSMKLLESMSLGLPAVATRVGGNQEIIEDGVTGFLTAPDNTEEFSDAIMALYKDNDRSHLFGNAAFKRFNERFHVKTMLDSYVALYGQTSKRQ
jgi:glycosyltransferase involved in cell wall biosynthesis